MGAQFFRRWSQKRSKAEEAACSSDTTQSIPEKNSRLERIRASWRHFRHAGEDWAYLALLGCSMALVSIWMDWTIERFNALHIRTYDYVSTFDGENRLISMFSVWVGYMVLLIASSALLVHYLAPQAIGSGIPEMKTILRGVVLKEYLTLRTFFTKVIGLTLALGSGLPLGKEGPFVHVSSILASQLSRLIHGFKGIYENESRSSEMLAAGCAVGVACTFSAPMGGVLFSIEVTSVFFAVRNYWRGFFSAACAAIVMRVLIPVLKDPELDLNAFFQTHFPPGKAFTLEEMPFFVLLGLICGLLGALFIFLHRKIVLFLRRNVMMRNIFQRYWLLYPILITLLVGIITFPEGFGQYMAGKQKFTRTVHDLFMNCTWTLKPNQSIYGCPKDVTQNWSGRSGDTPVFISLWGFSFVFYFLSILCTTLPIPAGIFMPVFVLGAAFGRLLGEHLSVLFGGFIFGVKSQAIYPGVYAVVGTAAFAGAVTHTVSVAVIIFEVTGQVLFLLPVMIAVIIANAVCSYFQPSIFDSIIRMKHLPYLPDIRSTSSVFHAITADRVMVTPVQFVSRDTTYRRVHNMLIMSPQLRAFPIVESNERMTLLGSVSRIQLEDMLEHKVGDETRREEANRRVQLALASARQEVIEDTRFIVTPTEEQSETVLERWAREQHDIHSRISTILGFEEKKTTEDNHIHPTFGGIIRSITRHPFSIHRFRDHHNDNQFDLWGEERIAWETAQLSEKIHLEEVIIDPSPFQIVAHTSLFKVHSLFSLLGLNRAYVTQHGMLVGVIALREVRQAIEKATNGQLLPLALESAVDAPEATVQSPEAFLRPPTSEYDDDHSDYEDNLQGKLEVVARGRCGHVTDDEEDAPPPFAFSLGSRKSDFGSSKDPLSLRRLQARRDSTRMDEMTRRRSSVTGPGGRRSSMQGGGRRYSVFPLPESSAPREDDQDSNFGSSYGFSFNGSRNSYGNPFDKSYGGGLNVSNLGTLKEVPSRADIKIEITEAIEEEPVNPLSKPEEEDKSKDKKDAK